MTTKVVNIKKDVYDVYVGRPSIWGNPFNIGQGGTRDEVIQKYRQYLQTRPDLLSKIPSLFGKTLGCHCHPKHCHADVLAQMANANHLFT